MINAVKSQVFKNAAGVSHAFFGRRGGVSTGIFASLNCGPGSGDDLALVEENRTRALSFVGGAHLNTVYQIHSAEAVAVAGPWAREDAPKADGMATNVPGVALGVLTADCAPVLFADPVARVIGAAHAGWKGALHGVVEATIDRMLALGAQRDRIAIAIGPTISQANYEVGPEFFDRFAAADRANERFFIPSTRAMHWRFDLPGYLLDRISRAGSTNVQNIGLCTYAHEPDYFSFRRTTHRGEDRYGRNLSLIVLA